MYTDRASQLNALLTSASHLTQNPHSSRKFILFRTIGNDLPPRHTDGQTVRNLRFILENERPKPDLDVRWYVNRVLDDENRLQIVKLLVQHNQLFTIDFFNYSEYAKVQFNFEISSDDGVDILRSSLFREFPETDFKRLRVWDTIFEPKNQYIIRNNIVRNILIKLGSATNATYILPWDGNCFLTDRAWRNISSSIDVHVQSRLPDVATRYFYVPMTRMTDNNLLKNDSFSPADTDEEPQVIFHRDATTRFDESKPYGYRPKVDLLWRLRIPAFQFRDKDGSIMRDTQSHKLAKDIPGYDSVRPVGWTARLYSGNRALEQDGAAVLRGRSRANGIELLAARAWLSVAQRTAKYSYTSSLFMYDTDVISERLQQLASRTSHPATAQHISKLVSDADAIVRLDDRHPPQHPHNLSKDTAHTFATVTLAGLFSGDRRFITWAALKARQLMVTGSTRVRSSDARNAGDLISMCIMLDAAKMLGMVDGISSLDQDAIRAWAYEISQSLDENSAAWKQVYFQQDRNAVLFEAGAGCVHAAAGSFHLAVRRLGLANGRLVVMGRDAGNSSFVSQEGLLGLEAWVVVAQMASRIGMNTWQFTPSGSDQPALRTVARAVLQRNADPVQRDWKRLHCVLTSIAQENSSGRSPLSCFADVKDDGALPADSVMPPFPHIALFK